eukprot:TRINITY_DN10282_c0_g1_i2.p1 TRINITY_DN10282_c0_g1~~TRINITY_DN10282_c0_g1_i2.p1  ORF type:complete len:111 (-),score=7.54 TRINITY_DN10282_c0_g1_i2:118-450(-)
MHKWCTARATCISHMVIHHVFSCTKQLGVRIGSDCDPQLLHEQTAVVELRRHNLNIIIPYKISRNSLCQERVVVRLRCVPSFFKPVMEIYGDNESICIYNFPKIFGSSAT